jgi:ribonuclease Z
MLFKTLVAVLACGLASATIWASDRAHKVKVTVLGTGTPYPHGDRSGPAVLVEAAGKKLLFDCGRGVVIRLGQAGVQANDIDAVFLTHLHSDHVVGLPDLLLTGWLLGRRQPLRLWAPAGGRTMAQHLVQAFAFDRQIRAQTAKLQGKGAEFEVHEVGAGELYDDGQVRVRAFVVDHGPVKPAFGYRIDYAGHTVVISGDTKFSENLIASAKDADCLIHVAWSIGAKDATPPSQRSLASAEDAARVFAAVKPKIAVVYHYDDDDGMTDAIQAGYGGQFIIARDLTEIVIGQDVTWRILPILEPSRLGTSR